MTEDRNSFGTKQGRRCAELAVAAAVTEDRNYLGGPHLTASNGLAVAVAVTEDRNPGGRGERGPRPQSWRSPSR